jgi:hypothetical protein
MTARSSNECAGVAATRKSRQSNDDKSEDSSTFVSTGPRLLAVRNLPSTRAHLRTSSSEEVFSSVQTLQPEACCCAGELSPPGSTVHPRAGPE